MSNLKIIYVDSSKGPILFNSFGCLGLNLNSLIKKSYNEKYVLEQLQSLKYHSSVNLCNLLSLCHKIQISYCSNDCLAIVQKIVGNIRQINPNIVFLQNGLENYMEKDVYPMESLVKVSPNVSIIYINRILKDFLNSLGYADGQLTLLANKLKDLSVLIPKDKLDEVIVNEVNLAFYKKLKEIMSC